MRTLTLVCTPALVLALLLAGTTPAVGATIVVGHGGNLQAALDAAQPGDVILLEPGVTYVGSFVIRRSVTLRTNGPLPSGRITPDWSGHLAILQSPTGEPALRTAAGVSQVRIIGVEIRSSGQTGATSVLIGSPTETDASRQPYDVVLDRLLVRGHPTAGQKRGLSLHGSHIMVIRSHVSDMKLQGQDTQAIWINNGWGPYAIADNYLEASGENILTGGDTPRIDQLVPSDIAIEGNTIAKPLGWKQEKWTVKNLIELKSARRVVIRGNLLEGSWVSGQVGYGILLTPKDQYGRAPWTTVQDVIVEQNVIHEVGEGIRVLGDDHVYPVVRSERIAIRHNLMVVDHRVHGGSGRCLTVGRAPQWIEFSANTCIATGASSFYTFWGGSVREITGGVFRDNVFLHNQYGFSAEGATAGGLAALTLHYPGGVLVDNIIGGGSPARYPGNVVMSLDQFQTLFVDYAGGDFRLLGVPAAPGSGGSWSPALPSTAPAPAPVPEPEPVSVAPAPMPEPSPAPVSATLPAGWSSGDVGSVGLTGTASGSGDAFTITGSGADIWGTSDAFHFAYRTLTGDGSITARVSTLEAVHPWTKAGVMMRESLEAHARHAMMVVSADRGAAFQRRVSRGGASTHTSGGAGHAPRWVRLTRTANTFEAFVSADGHSWTRVGEESIAMPATIYVGIPLTSHEHGIRATATVDHVHVGLLSSALPPGWTSQDIGAVGPQGSATATGGRFSIAGAGADIWGASDAFHFAYRTLTGDGSITARVTSLSAVHAWTKAGVMMRETLAPDAPHAMMVVSGERGPAFQRRTSSGGTSTHTSGGSAAAPLWVRLMRSGNAVSGFISADGINWTLVRRETIVMAPTIYVGLAITSHDETRLAEVTIDAVTVTGP